MVGWKLYQISNILKKTFFCSWVLCSGILLYTPPCYALTINEAIETIVNNSPELKIILEKREQALTNYKGNRAAYLPSIYLDYVRKYEKPEPLNNPVLSNWTGSNKFQLILEQRIFDMQALASITRGSYLVQSQEFENQKLLEALIQLAITSYYDVIQAEYVYAVNKESFLEISGIEKLIYKMRSQGNATLGDINLIQSRLAEANTALLAAKSNLDRVKARLAYLLNIVTPYQDYNTNITPNEVLPELTNKDFFDLADKLVSFMPLLPQELQKEAVRNNVDILLIRSNLCAAGYKLEEQKAKYLPTITATINLKDEEYKSDNTISRIGKLEIETKYYLFDGGARYAGVKNAESYIRELEYNYDIKIRDIRDRAYNSFSQLKNLEQQRLSILKEIESTEEVDRVYRQQFKYGTRNLVDRLDNITRLVQARIKLISIDYSILMSRIDVLILQGQFVEFFGFQNYLDYNKLNLC